MGVMTYDTPPFSDDDAPPDNVIWFDAPPAKKERKKRPQTAFKTGSEVELAQRATSDLGHVIAHSGLLWVLQPDKTWAPMDLGPDSPYGMTTWLKYLARYDGEPCGDKPIRISSGTAKGAWVMALATHAVSERDIPTGCATKSGFVTLQDNLLSVRPLESVDHQSDLWPVEYVYSDEAPWWDYVCQQWFDDRWKSVQSYIEAHAGLCYLGESSRYERVLLIRGPEGNGKSTLMHALTGFVPPAACTASPPDTWDDDNKVLPLRQSRMNFVTELNDSERIPGGRFKAVVSSESFQIRPIYRPAATMRSRAGHIFNANKWPPAEKTAGFFARWAVLLMEKHFRGESWEIPRAELYAHLTCEASAIFSRCVRAAAAVIRQGLWVEPDWSKDAKEIWKRHIDPVASYIHARLERTETGKIGVMEAYRDYLQFCESDGIRPQTKPGFVQSMEHNGILVRRGDTRSRFCARRVYEASDV